MAIVKAAAAPSIQAGDGRATLAGGKMVSVHFSVNRKPSADQAKKV